MAFNSTTGLGVAAKIVVTSPLLPKTGSTVPNYVELSLSALSPDSSGYQIEAQVTDLAGNEQLGNVLVLTSAANASGTSPADTVYQGTITGGGTNNFVGYIFVVAGFGNAGNNGTFQCVANTTTSITLANPYGISETTAATATFATSPSTSPLTFWSQNPKVCTVSSDGFIQGLTVGNTMVEVSYPFASNTLGDVPGGTGSPANLQGWAYEKVYFELNISVIR